MAGMKRDKKLNNLLSSEKVGIEKVKTQCCFRGFNYRNLEPTEILETNLFGVFKGGLRENPKRTMMKINHKEPVIIQEYEMMKSVPTCNICATIFIVIFCCNDF